MGQAASKGDTTRDIRADSSRRGDAFAVPGNELQALVRPW